MLICECIVGDAPCVPSEIILACCCAVSAMLCVCLRFARVWGVALPGGGEEPGRVSAMLCVCVRFVRMWGVGSPRFSDALRLSAFCACV